MAFNDCATISFAAVIISDARQYQNILDIGGDLGGLRRNGFDERNTFPCPQAARGVINCCVRRRPYYLAGNPVPVLKAMNSLCAGLNHQSAPLEVREKFAVGTHGIAEALSAIRRIDGLAGAVILSTCNRGNSTRPASVRSCAGGAASLLRDRTGVDALPHYHGWLRSVRHLFV